jgi:hypothetical protein
MKARFLVLMMVLGLMSVPAFSGSVTVNLQGIVTSSMGLGLNDGDLFSLAITYESATPDLDPGNSGFFQNAITRISVDSGTSILDYDLPGSSQIVISPGFTDLWLAGVSGFSGPSGSLNLPNLQLSFPSGTFTVPIVSLVPPPGGVSLGGFLVANGTLNNDDSWNLTGEQLHVVPEPATLTLLAVGLIAGAAFRKRLR